MRKTGSTSNESNNQVTVDAKPTTNDEECLQEFSSRVAQRFSWPNQLVGFLLHVDVDNLLSFDRCIPAAEVGTFLPLDDAVASRAVFVIVSGSDVQAETLLEPAK